MKIKKQFCIIIAGPTGVGKTDFSLALQDSMPIEIINADLGQSYTPLSIGTAKPDWKNESIPHHLFDIVNEPRSLTVIEFRVLVYQCIVDIWKRGAVPVIVGGSTFYVESLFFPPREVLASIPIQKDSSNYELSWDYLKRVDPERAAQIHPHDTYRIKRALDLYHAGIMPSEQKPVYDPLCSYYYLYLTRDRDDLYQRINQRVEQMIQAGWLDEARSLINTPWEPFIHDKKFIGYSELISYLKQPNNNEKELKDLIDLIAQKTRNYAKRQETYWRRLEKKLDNCLVHTREYTRYQGFMMHCNVTKTNPEVYCKQLTKLINESESDVQ